MCGTGQNTATVTKLSLKLAQDEQKWRKSAKTKILAILWLAKGLN